MYAHKILRPLAIFRVQLPENKTNKQKNLQHVFTSRADCRILFFEI